jgi:hypothetical protein
MCYTVTTAESYAVSMAEKHCKELGDLAEVMGKTSLSAMLREGGVITRPLARCIMSCLPRTADAYRQADEAKRRVVHLLEKKQEKKDRKGNPQPENQQ